MRLERPQEARPPRAAHRYSCENEHHESENEHHERTHARPSGERPGDDHRTGETIAASLILQLHCEDEPQAGGAGWAVGHADSPRRLTLASLCLSISA